MNRSHLLLAVGCLWLAGCTAPGGDALVVGPQHKPAPSATAEAPIDRWDALRPDEVTYQRPPPQIGLSRNGMEGVGGLIDDTGSGTPPGLEIDHSSPDRAKQFGSSRVVDAVDGRAVDLDGYVVPLGTNDAGLVDELLFVPFYGACIHVPPPPPNQIIHVTLATPIALGDLWDPYRLAGRLQVKRFDADIASASYDAAAATLTAIRN
ncbi:DUF3299 domain-containing protein [Stenotrophomonas geniculata]|uniref:DUF3299 domain-containing protein n=1 Tax=Stenotrophomonas geniculata TaxID=86188 RepID=UPI002ACEF00D|nr:DUF3299 domain-containing protein [Stenotrophomonas geniculata]